MLTACHEFSERGDSGFRGKNNHRRTHRTGASLLRLRTSMKASCGDVDLADAFHPLLTFLLLLEQLALRTRTRSGERATADSPDHAEEERKAFMSWGPVAPRASFRIRVSEWKAPLRAASP